MGHVHDALVNVAPERKDEFVETYSEFVLEYSEDHHWICSVDVANKEIRISSKVVEVFWAASFAYFRLYTDLQNEIGGHVAVAVQLDLKSPSHLKVGMDLLRWALDSWLNRQDVGWPSQLPQPTPSPSCGSDEHVAQELSLCATSFVVHHELSHIRLEHEGKSQIDAEREADQAAAEWVLGGVEDERDARFTKRALGMAVALAILVVRGMHTGDYGGNTHPRSYDRLMHTFDQHISDPNHKAWWFLVAILKLHLDNAAHGASVPLGPFDSARHCVDAFVDALSRIS